jgi:hypothetical protein
MRHWHPFIAETMAQMAQDGVRQIIAICMAPHYSTMSIGAYRRKLDEAVEAAGSPMSVDFVESWYTQPDYLTGIAANVEQTLARFPKGKSVTVIFTAHSLPASILERGDPYDRQLRETAAMTAERLNLPGDRWTFQLPERRKNGRALAGTADRRSGGGPRTAGREEPADRAGSSSPITSRCCTTWTSACSRSPASRVSAWSARRCSTTARR